MEKRVRCTVCTWRGSLSDAADAPPVRPSEIPESLTRIQAAYAERRAELAKVGADPLPPCPACGHHLQIVRRESLRPAV
jgi:hypothetical protein